jgi:hypothetical protein
VIRGSSDTVVQPSSDSNAPPVVLRGSPPAAVQAPVAEYACPPGSDYAPGDGCGTSGYAYAPYDHDYWPYYGFDGVSSGDRDQGFRNGLAHVVGREFAPRFGHLLTNGFGHGLVQTGGFGRR